jgi:hypothetical protein
VRGTATLFCAAFGAFVGDDISLLRVGLDEDRLHKTEALAGAVAGVFVDMYRPQTEGAVVARGRAEWLYLSSAMTADESRVVFCKSFIFKLHIFASFLLFFEKSSLFILNFVV